MNNYVWPWPIGTPEDLIPFIKQEKENILAAAISDVFYDYEYKYPTKVTSVLFSFFLYCGISAQWVVDNLYFMPRRFLRYIVLDEKLVFGKNIYDAQAGCLLDIKNLDIVIDTNVEIPAGSIDMDGGSIILGELCDLDNDAVIGLRGTLVLCYSKHLNQDRRLRECYISNPKNFTILD